MIKSIIIVGVLIFVYVQFSNRTDSVNIEVEKSKKSTNFIIDDNRAMQERMDYKKNQHYSGKYEKSGMKMSMLELFEHLRKIKLGAVDDSSINHDLTHRESMLFTVHATIMIGQHT